MSAIISNIPILRHKKRCGSHRKDKMMNDEEKIEGLKI
jgi:hypothetical protein